MKHTKSILAALVAALSVGAASATTTKTNGVYGDQIFIAGSTAMASKSMPAIDAYLTNVAQGYSKIAADNASASSAKIALYTKVVTTTNGSTVTITTNGVSIHFIGSEGGTLVTASKTTQPFLPISFTGSVTKDATVGGFVVPSAQCTYNTFATITFSDVNQAVGRFAAGSKTSPVKTVALQEVGSGINAVNFAFVAPTNFPGSNITDQVARELLSVGHVPLSHITGNASDSNSTVYITGRDIDSGTRSLTFIETGFGLLSSASQYMYDNTTGSFFKTVGGTNFFNGQPFTAGNGGYFSGGDLCTYVGNSATNVGVISIATANGTNNTVTAVSTNTGGTNYLIGYAGTADIIGKKNTIALSYNGVAPYSGTNSYAGFQTTNNGIANGSYSLWSIEHLYYNLANAPKGTLTNDIVNLANGVYSTLTNTPTVTLGYGYTALTDMNVKRSAYEGSTIISK
jgi:hypothetical protein